MKTTVKPFAFVYEALSHLPTRAIDKAVYEWQKMKQSGNKETIIAFCRKRCEQKAEKHIAELRKIPRAVTTKATDDAKGKERHIYHDAHLYDWYEAMHTRLVQGYGVLPESDRYETTETRELRRAELFAPRPNITLLEVGR